MKTEHIKLGLWYDHSQGAWNRRQILETDSRTGLITNFLAILITSTASPIYSIFLKHWGYQLWEKLASLWGAPKPRDEDPNQSELVEEAVMAIAGERWQHIRLGQPAAPNGQPAPIGPLAYLGIIFLLVLLIAPSIGLMAASVVSARIASGNFGLSTDPTCGDYEYQFDAPAYSERFLEYERQAEAQAAEYATKCYGLTSVAADCNKFYAQNINYSSTESSKCPFNSDVCEGGNDAAFRISTGLQPGTLLGINAANPYFFGRTMTCAPITTKDEYVKAGISDRREEQWEYWYGPSLADYTWVNPMKESSWEIKGYSTGVHCYDPADVENNFEPLPDFRAGHFPVTMIFISSHSIFYPQYREDPVFLAMEKAKFRPGYPGPAYYIKNSTRAGIMGCVDEYQICKTQNGPCWSNNNISSIPQSPSDRNATEEENVITLLKLALDFSTSCGSVQFRQAEALDAQSKIAHIQSLPLPEKQWEVEAEKMFQTSLARMQLNVYDIVRGTASMYEGYQNVLNPSYRGLCQLVQIPTPGYTNINFWGLIGTILAVVLLWVIHLRRFLLEYILKSGMTGLLNAAKWVGIQMDQLGLSKILLACWYFLEDHVIVPLSNLLIGCL